MGDNKEVMQQVSSWAPPLISYPVLTPNMNGYKQAISAGAKEVAVFGAASEAFSQKNINCSINETLSKFDDIMWATLSQN